MPHGWLDIPLVLFPQPSVEFHQVLCHQSSGPRSPLELHDAALGVRPTVQTAADASLTLPTHLSHTLFSVITLIHPDFKAVFCRGSLGHHYWEQIASYRVSLTDRGPISHKTVMANFSHRVVWLFLIFGVSVCKSVCLRLLLQSAGECYREWRCHFSCWSPENQRFSTYFMVSSITVDQYLFQSLKPVDPPKKFVFVLSPVVRFIHLDCFDLNCLVLEILAVEMSWLTKWHPFRAPKKKNRFEKLNRSVHRPFLEFRVGAFFFQPNYTHQLCGLAEGSIYPSTCALFCRFEHHKLSAI